jgi:hypothetical protein
MPIAVPASEAGSALSFLRRLEQISFLGLVLVTFVSELLVCSRILAFEVVERGVLGVSSRHLNTFLGPYLSTAFPANPLFDAMSKEYNLEDLFNCKEWASQKSSPFLETVTSSGIDASLLPESVPPSTTPSETPEAPEREHCPHQVKLRFVQEAEWNPDQPFVEDPSVSSLPDRVEGNANSKAKGHRAGRGAGTWLLLALCLARPIRAFVVQKVPRVIWCRKWPPNSMTF